MASDEQSLSKFDKFEIFLDRCVSCGEAVIVLSLLLVIVSAIFFETVWILWPGSDHQTRFNQVLKNLNDNWKVGLVVLIPLFFRAIRAFLERLEEVGGVKAPHKTKTSDPKKEQKDETEQKQEKEEKKGKV
jgi:hypothetical protein